MALLRGLIVKPLKKDDDIVESLFDRILGRTSLYDIEHPETGDLLLEKEKRSMKLKLRLLKLLALMKLKFVQFLLVNRKEESVEMLW